MPGPVVQKSIRLMGALVPALVILTAATPAAASHPGVCVPVQLTGAGQDLGPDGQGHLRTTATVLLGGFPIATTDATFTPAGPPVDNVLSFTGPIVFTPRLGTSTLTADVHGSVDVMSGAFQATSATVSGTGLLAGVSGELTFAGTENVTTQAFSETITGTLCTPVG
jgi:hypothetical protein